MAASKHPTSKTSLSTCSKPHERHVIAKNGILTSVVLSFVFYILYFFTPFPLPPLPTVTDRIIFTLRCQTFPCLCVMAAIMMTSLARYFSIAIDPINGNGEHLVALKVRFLTNTLEQFVVSFVGQLILTTFLNENQMKAIPILALFFVFGRITFYLGYSASYLKRTVGYVATYTVTFVVWVVNVCFLTKSMFVA